VPPPPAGAYHHWVPTPLSATDVVSREIAMTPIARVAAAFFGINLLIGLVNLQLNRSALLAQGRRIRVIYDAAENGRHTPSFTTQSTTDPLQVIFGLIGIAALVVALMWQHRAASSARALGLRATHSPAWGVGCWFVPIVNFWMPYQAIRDCLAPDDPHRALVLRWWLTGISAELLLLAAHVAAWFSSSVALGISIPAALFGLGLLASAPQVVGAISAAHRTAIERPRQL
jgi:hypothetical protein